MKHVVYALALCAGLLVAVPVPAQPAASAPATEPDAAVIDWLSNPDFSPLLADELCDTGVNMGVTVQVKMLQRWLNAFNQQGQLYPDLQPDGQVGPRTLVALKAYLAARGKEGEAVLLKALNASQGAYYLELAEQRAANETFVYGWVANRVGLGV